MASQNLPADGVVTDDTPQTFNFDHLPVRTFNKDGEVWFVAADVCAALEIANPRDAVSRLDDDERSTVVTTDSRSKGGATQRREVIAISESGLYALIMTSRKEEAKRFKRWVTHDVLPAIRKEGFYLAQSGPHVVEPVINVRALMLEGQSDPKVERPAAIDAAIDKRAWDIAREAYVVSYEHLQRRVAYCSEMGYPERVINKRAALQASKETNLDSALAHIWVKKVKSLRSLADSYMCAGQKLIGELDDLEKQFVVARLEKNHE